MTIETLYNRINFILREEDTGDHFNPDEIMDAINKSSIDKFEELIGNENSYINGRKPPIPIAAGLNQKVREELRPFRVPPAVFNVTNGVLDLPNDYGILEVLTSNRTTDGTNYRDRFRVVDYAELPDILTSHIHPPTVKEPVAVLASTGYEIYPSSIASVYLGYLRYPTEGVFAYTLTGDGRDVVFDQGNSTDIEWKEMSHNDILMRALNYLSVPIDNEKVFQYSLQGTVKGG